MLKFLRYFGKIKKDLVKEQFLEKKLLLFQKKSFQFSKIYNIKNKILIFLNNDDNVNFTSLLFLASIRNFYTGDIIAVSPTKTKLKKFNIFDNIFMYSTKDIKKYPKRFTNYTKRIKDIDSHISIILNNNPNIYEKYLISLSNSSIVIGNNSVKEFVNFSISFNRENYYLGEFFLKILEKLNIPSVRKNYFETYLEKKVDKNKKYIAISSSLLNNLNDLSKISVKFENKFKDSIFLVIYPDKNDKKIPIFNSNFINLYSKNFFEQLDYLSMCDNFITNHNILYHIYPLINRNNIILISKEMPKHSVYTTSKMTQYENLDNLI